MINMKCQKVVRSTRGKEFYRKKYNSLFENGGGKRIKQGKDRITGKDETENNR